MKLELSPGAECLSPAIRRQLICSSIAVVRVEWFLRSRHSIGAVDLVGLNFGYAAGTDLGDAASMRFVGRLPPHSGHSRLLSIADAREQSPPFAAGAVSRQNE